MGHSRVSIDKAQPYKYGFCAQHPKKVNEYFDYTKNKAICTICAIDIAQGKTDGHHELELLESAYKKATDYATHTDQFLDQRKQLLKNQMDQIANKINEIQQQATAAQATIQQIVERAINELYDVVQSKTSILKADRLELARQYKEIEFMTDFLQVQLEGTDPLEFLKLSQGHDKLKLEVAK